MMAKKDRTSQRKGVKLKRSSMKAPKFNAFFPFSLDDAHVFTRFIFCTNTRGTYIYAHHIVSWMHVFSLVDHMPRNKKWYVTRLPLLLAAHLKHIKWHKGIWYVCRYTQVSCKKSSIYPHTHDVFFKQIVRASRLFALNGG